MHGTFSVLAVLGELTPFRNIDPSSQSISSHMIAFVFAGRVQSPPRSPRDFEGGTSFPISVFSSHSGCHAKVFRRTTLLQTSTLSPPDIPLPFLITHPSFSNLIGSSNCRHMNFWGSKPGQGLLLLGVTAQS